jgi:hypothetical protein
MNFKRKQKELKTNKQLNITTRIYNKSLLELYLKHGQVPFEHCNNITESILNSTSLLNITFASNLEAT